MSVFRWSPKSRRAAELAVEGELSDVAIAREVGVNDRTLRRWRSKPAFQEKVKELMALADAEIERLAVCRRSRRLANLNKRYLALLRVIEERAADPNLRGVPGGSTGTVVLEPKTAGVRLIHVARVDVAILRELREIEMQAARERGEITDRLDLTTGGDAVGAPIKEVWIETVTRADLNPEERPQAGVDTVGQN